jgi:hypothetical protein
MSANEEVASGTLLLDLPIMRATVRPGSGPD